MALTIPAKHRPVFEQLLALSRVERDKLLEALQRLETPSLDVGQLSKQIVPDSPLTKEATEDAISVLISIYTLPHMMAITQEELAPAIIEALGKDRSLSVEPDQLEEFRPFIEGVLALESTLGLIAIGEAVERAQRKEKSLLPDRSGKETVSDQHRKNLEVAQLLALWEEQGTEEDIAHWEEFEAELEAARRG